MKLIKPPKILRILNKNIIWEIPNSYNKVFLTIDDCSDEELTLWVLDILREYGIKATFFCIGKYIEQNKLHLKIKKEGHQIGNHGYEHLNGFKISRDDYFSNVMKNNQFVDSDIFRPPYGKITLPEINLIKKNFRIIMWSILTYDFDETILPIECFENVKKNVRSGSIIVFHANKKSRRNMTFALRASIEFLLANNYNLNSLISNSLYIMH